MGAAPCSWRGTKWAWLSYSPGLVLALQFHIPRCFSTWKVPCILEKLCGISVHPFWVCPLCLSLHQAETSPCMKAWGVRERKEALAGLQPAGTHELWKQWMPSLPFRRSWFPCGWVKRFTASPGAIKCHCWARVDKCRCSLFAAFLQLLLLNSCSSLFTFLIYFPCWVLNLFSNR